MTRYRLLENLSDDDTTQKKNHFALTPFNDSQTLRLSGSDVEEGKPKFQLQRTIGVFTGINIVVGSMIGSGIFIVPTGVLKHCLGNIPLSIGVWIVGGLIAISVALCYCELATMFPHSGGSAAYLKEIYGDFLCFLFLWMLLFTAQPQGSAVQIIALGDYISNAIQSATAQCPEENSVFLSKLIGSAVSLLVLVCNITKVNFATKLQDICTVGKVFALFIICVAGFIMIILDSSVLKSNFAIQSTSFVAQNVTQALPRTPTVGLSDFSLAVFQALWAYDGFDNITCITEELKKPKKSLPLIIIFSTLFVTVLYLMVNISYFAVLNGDELMSSNAVAISFANKIHPALSYFVTLGVCLSLIGSINVNCLTAGRMPYVAARWGFMPKALSMVHVNFLSPMPALLFIALLSAIMLIPSSIDMLLKAVVFVLWAFRGICVLGLLIFRKRNKDHPRPYKVYLLTALIGMIASFYITSVPVLYQPQALYLLALIMVAVFYCVYRLMLAKYVTLEGVGSKTVFFQKLFLVASPDN